MKSIDPRIAGVLAAAIAVAGCVQTPVAPMTPVAPGPNKSFDAFGADQAFCQQYAAAQTAPAVAAANNQAVGGTILTTALGAGLGAAIGGGRGAAIGAASGAGLGTVVGAGSSSFAQMSVQQQYDIFYGQCMAAHGNSVPGFSPPPGTPPYQGGPWGPPPDTRSYYPGAPVAPPPGY
jgi:outer membrane lipoprotein SlyB